MVIYRLNITIILEEMKEIKIVNPISSELGSTKLTFSNLTML